MFKKNYLLTLLFINFLILSSFKGFADSIDSIPDFSKKLWYNFSSSDDLYLNKIKLYNNAGKFEEAKKLCHKFKKESSKKDDENFSNLSEKIIVVRKDFSDAICRYIEWQKYINFSNSDDISFNEISQFIINNQYFYDIDKIKENVEKLVISKNLKYEDLAQYFALNPPISLQTKIHLLQLKIDFFNSGNISDTQLKEVNSDINLELSKIWIEENFNSDEENKFLSKYGKFLSEKDHIARIERLLINGRDSEAKRIFNLVNQDHQKLFDAITKIATYKRYINNYILSVPRKLRSNEVLLYKRVLWYKAKNEDEELIEILTKLDDDIKFYDHWWRLRMLYARELLKKKNYKDSYKIISNSNLPLNHSKYWEYQWTSGWIALRFLDQPREAYQHFINLYNNVQQPVSISRAAYWLGMTFEAMGREDDALEWYKTASNYPIYFYGQLAIKKYDNLIKDKSKKIQISLPKSPEISADDIVKISNSKAVQIAFILLKMGERENASKLLENIILNLPSRGQIAIVMKIVNEFSDRALEVKLARQAAKRNVFFVADSFQVLDSLKDNPNSPLIHAIIRQESGFAQDALSSAGAVGFMQVMPNTAKLVAKELGIGYSSRKLSRDVDYNIKIGSHYIDSLVKKFDGSEILAIAAYNAGPNNAFRWIEEFYDPRDVGSDLNKVIDWIELITYYETRNYVQRIMENVIVYKYLLSKDKEP